MAGHNGAELANPLGVMEAHAEATFASLVPETRRRWRAAQTLATVPFFFAAVLMLWTSGYPRWRVGVVAAVFAGFTILLPRASGAWTSRRTPSALPGVVWPEFANALLVLVVVGITGGLRSPLLTALSIGIVTLYSTIGPTPFVRRIVALESAGLAAMLFAPEWLVGPAVAGSSFNFIAAGIVVAAVVTNVSVVAVHKRAREASEAALGRAREQVFAQLSQRTRDMETVGASLSHELKNPLQAIKILVQLSTREAEDPRARDRLRVVEAEVERMPALIKDYLSFSRPFDKLQPLPLKLGSVCDDVISVLRDRADACGVSLQRQGDARVEADARRLQEALHNLVSNAIDATPRGGIIRLVVAEANGCARIEVHDSGKGMTSEMLEKIGTPFFTTREDGTGLGVALARAAFLQHGGSLEYRSEPGAGTTAMAILPLKPMGRSVDAARAGG